MSRSQRKNLGVETVAIMQAGTYQVPEVGSIDISEAIQNSVERATHFHFSRDLSQEASTLFTQRSQATSKTNIRVTTDGTIEAILKLGEEIGENEVCAMNFASAKNPGGGFLRGSSAQEESLARSSTLYPTLVKFLDQEVVKREGSDETYYNINRKIENRGIYTSCAIYSPSVQVIRSEDGQLRTPMSCSFVTIPAPNKTVKNCPRLKSATEALIDRIDRTLAIALLNNHSHLVLGAFGCGVFGNDPAEVAFIFKKLIFGKYDSCFETIVFAIKTSKPETDENFQAFLRAFAS
jgi:uncharacterized protein (TIGR02452 family)